MYIAQIEIHFYHDTYFIDFNMIINRTGSYKKFIKANMREVYYHNQLSEIGSGYGVHLPWSWKYSDRGRQLLFQSL